MIYYKWTRILLLVPLLLSLLGSTPAQALTGTPKLLWCPATVTAPTPKQAGCTPAFTSMTALWTHLTTHMPAQAGTIWIQVGYNSITAGDGNLGFDGMVLTKMAKYPLNFKGGWKGPGTSALNLQAPATLQGHTLAVFNWKGKVSIKNFTVVLDAASAASACDNAAVCVKTAGGIQLDRVHEENSTNLTIGFGAILNNGASLSSPPGSVVVTNSKFLKNNNSGLSILTKGAVSLKSVTANENDSFGADIFNDATASPVAITNGQFNQNQYGGASISSNGIVTLTNVYAEGTNAGTGMRVNNTSGSADVIIKGTNSFLGNNGTGLLIYSNGNVTAQHLVAYQNIATGSFGVFIDTSTAPAAKGVTISGSGKFMGNPTGLIVFSRGNVRLNGVIAASNINNGILVYADGDITLTCSDAYGNGTGLYVRALNGVGSVPKLTLQGFLNTYRNTTPEDILATSIIRTACPTG